METAWEHKDKEDTFSYQLDHDTLFIHGNLDVNTVSLFYQEIKHQLASYELDYLNIDLSQVAYLDSAGVTGLELLKQKLKEAGTAIKYVRVHESFQPKLELFTIKNEEVKSPRQKQGFFFKLGDQVHSFYREYLRKFLLLTADVFYWSFRDLFTAKSQKKGEFYNQAVLIGVNAVPIVAALSFIIGLVLALQSAAQLRSFGANIYIVDLTVIAMMREMGPLITAILVAGRSGSAIAAEVATMKVTSELDALTTMALNPIRFVIVPKMHGAIFTLPFLTILANLLGIIGGMTVAYFYLDISADIFINRMTDSLYTRDILTGFVKSVFFAGIIVLTGTYYGFHVDKGAEGVGKVTTSAVVVSITLVIIIDSIFSLIFY
ncbi:MAG: ABC transporter permease [Candidatus Cyclobacteriaceae bacterium M3_2C_046]